MCSIILTICILIPFIRADYDETPAVVDPQYGQNMYCHFAYFGAVDPNNMKQCNSQQAQQFGPGRVKGCKVGFTTWEDGTVVDTLLLDPNGVACGMAYLLPVTEFPKLLQSTFDCNNQKYEKLITVKVEVTKDNQQISLYCNAFKELTAPTGNEVPCKDDLQIGIDAYTAAQLPQDCITRLQQIPTQECECTSPP